jgi:hypothetical protein
VSAPQLGRKSGGMFLEGRLLYFFIFLGEESKNEGSLEEIMTEKAQNILNQMRKRNRER